jgi:peptide/nickel transport system substrate-binding protein
MDEAGVSEASMDLMVSTDYPETVTAAQVIADNLAAIGIDVSIRTLDMATWLDNQDQGEFDALIMGWLGNLDPDDYYYAQHHSEGPSNAQGYANPDVDELLDAGRQELDEDRRRELYAEAATLIADDVSYLYLYNPSVIQAHAQRLTGYEMRSDRAVRFRDVNLEEDA